MFISACMAGVRRGGKGERQAHEAWEDRMREDHGAHFDFPPLLRPVTQAVFIFPLLILYILTKISIF